MRQRTNSTLLLLVLFALASCGDPKPAESPKPAAAEPPAQEEAEPVVDGSDDVTDEIGAALSGEDDSADANEDGEP